MSADGVHGSEMDGPHDFDDGAADALIRGAGADIDRRVAETLREMRAAYVSTPPAVGATLAALIGAAPPVAPRVVRRSERVRSSVLAKERRRSHTDVARQRFDHERGRVGDVHHDTQGQSRWRRVGRRARSHARGLRPRSGRRRSRLGRQVAGQVLPHHDDDGRLGERAAGRNHDNDDCGSRRPRPGEWLEQRQGQFRRCPEPGQGSLATSAAAAIDLPVA